METKKMEKTNKPFVVFGEGKIKYFDTLDEAKRFYRLALALSLSASLMIFYYDKTPDYVLKCEEI